MEREMSYWNHYVCQSFTQMTQLLQYMTISPLSILGSKGDKEKIYKQHRKSPANKAQKTSSQHAYEIQGTWKQSWKQIYGYRSTDFLKTQGGPGSLYPFWVLVLGCWEKGLIGTDKPPKPIFKFIQKWLHYFSWRIFSPFIWEPRCLPRTFGILSQPVRLCWCLSTWTITYWGRQSWAAPACCESVRCVQAAKHSCSVNQSPSSPLAAVPEVAPASCCSWRAAAEYSQYWAPRKTMFFLPMTSVFVILTEPTVTVQTCKSTC